MLFLNILGVVLCAYWVARDTTWTWQWWLSGIGLFCNAFAVLSVLSNI